MVLALVIITVEGGAVSLSDVVFIVLIMIIKVLGLTCSVLKRRSFGVVGRVVFADVAVSLDDEVLVVLIVIL